MPSTEVSWPRGDAHKSNTPLTMAQELCWGIGAGLVLCAYFMFCLWYDGKLGMTPWW